ncbi:flagellar biosynthesis; hook-filament junction protein 1 [Xenorhabdus bovienii str. Jollieti]|uniref:Flagellar hook-associated protein 1 n=1 Tax=Xenorhabdus bovienii (strain SS-2004) TaxID=406818 RepID=D3V2X2_XENBS|nr:flagellar hook-associated protein FlgK [Xenorhabdus bovienii]CBJ81087.1 flagellar biosynthesis; hook-filament junction protein 1 [Xenorhabdus bovienii SS-2004]CDH26946.1 flagellar biosynthesis; hook-filament junction protein 1 [Xenorhabdus bovienii str. Jollieti]
MSNSLMNTAMSGINAAQVAMGVVGNNIANSKNVGYNRQTTVLTQNNGTLSPAGFIGNGVAVSSINREYSEFINQQHSSAQTKHAALTAYNQQITKINDLLADKDTSLSNSIEEFFKSLGAAESNAEDSAARTTVLGKAEGLVSRFKEADEFLRQIDNSINSQIEQNAREINKYAEEVATLNNEITRMRGTGTGEPLALLDKRDEAVNKLNQLVDVNVTQQDGGVYNVSFGGGMSLVSGSKSYRLEAISSSTDSSRITLGYNNGTVGTKEIDERFISQGTLGGALQVRREVVDSSRNQLNQLALVMADQFNQVQNGGFDLKGKPGVDFFNFTKPDVISNSNNKGTADIKVEYADTTKVKNSDYTLKYEGGDWKVQRVSDKAAVPVTKNGNALEFDGLKVEIDAAHSQDHDTYTLKTVSNVVATLEVNLQDSSQLATAGDKDAGPSDNRNAKKFLALQDQRLIDGKSSFAGAYASLVSQVGSKANEAQVSVETQGHIVDKLYATRESISGVNMDEEYGAMQRLQQYYLANARVIQTAATLFDAILGIR